MYCCQKVKSGKSNLKDIFDAGGRESSLASSQGVSPSDESSYKMRIQANDMRRVILENQLEVRHNLFLYQILFNMRVKIGGCSDFGESTKAQEKYHCRYREKYHSAKFTNTCCEILK